MILLPLSRIPSSIIIKSSTDQKGFREVGNRELVSCFSCVSFCLLHCIECMV